MKRDESHSVLRLDLQEFLMSIGFLEPNVNGFNNNVMDAPLSLHPEEKRQHVVARIAGVERHLLEEAVAHHVIAPPVQLDEFNSHERALVQLREGAAELRPLFGVQGFVFHVKR